MSKGKKKKKDKKRSLKDTLAKMKVTPPDHRVCSCCPVCQDQNVTHLENTEPDASGEYKGVWHCDDCDALWYVVVLPKGQPTTDDYFCRSPEEIEKHIEQQKDIKKVLSRFAY